MLRSLCTRSRNWAHMSCTYMGADRVSCIGAPETSIIQIYFYEPLIPVYNPWSRPFLPLQMRLQIVEASLQLASPPRG